MKLFNAWKKEDRDRAVIHVQSRFIIVLVLLCALISVGWMTAPSRLRVYIPPDISNGATIKVSEIPAPLIYSFTYEIWQELNYWPEDGSKNYQKNLHTFAAYLTPEFQAELLEESKDLLTSGQIQRQRFLQGKSGSAFDVASVKKLSGDSWEVDLKVRLMEYKNNQLVKDVEILYPLKVIRHDVSNSINPYGLAISGFVAAPQRLKTYI
ncbi:MAG TPA: TIGR03746 family integrating conjugative element protein [Gammaproteobacteria bacterium]|nr:TIGR03746 family integrating conjugative element protein [Gammaproteobacteria bacterium]HVY53945.1 TIGR03746 family integrating conjugative element protein [Gammaproteobacteria bacterium]